MLIIGIILTALVAIEHTYILWMEICSAGKKLENDFLKTH